MSMTGAKELKSRRECHTTNFRQFCIVDTSKYEHLREGGEPPNLSYPPIAELLQVARATFRDRLEFFMWFLIGGLNL